MMFILIHFILFVMAYPHSSQSRQLDPSKPPRPDRPPSKVQSVKGYYKVELDFVTQPPVDLNIECLRCYEVLLVEPYQLMCY